MFWIIALAILVPLAIVLAWYNLSPQFGKRLSQEQKALFQKLSYHDGQVFQNDLKINMDIDFIPTLMEWFRKDPSRQPQSKIQPQSLKPEALDNPSGPAQLYWFGHSAFLGLADGQRFLIDPMFGQHSAPHPWLGTARYSSQLPLEVQDFPEIDFVLISHDHYDHLDLKSVQQLEPQVKRFLVPLGLANHLKSWGIPESKIQEFAWHDQIQLGSIQATFTPARHFSGRGLFDRSETLWGSWVIQSSESKIYFSGDSGYGPHYQEIGERYGPFDLALMECGQYNEAWKDVHMMPEESVQAAIDLKSKRYMPIHWAGFTLSFHPWSEPVERSLQAAQSKALEFISPEIGELIDLSAPQLPQSRWWESIPTAQ